MYSYLAYLVRHWEQKVDTAIGAWFEGVGAIPGAIIRGAVGGICGSFGASLAMSRNCWYDLWKVIFHTFQ